MKNFALTGLARKIGGTPLNLIVDNDTLKSTSLRFPVIRVAVRRLVSNRSHSTGSTVKRHTNADQCSTWRCFARSRIAPRPCGQTGASSRYYPRSGGPAKNIGDAFTAIRRECESEWGCQNLELAVSQLSQTEAFTRFAQHILDDLPRFRETYNSSIQEYREANGIRSGNHPAPDLAEDEAPFWVWTMACRRERATSASDVRTLRPRALTLTLFARLCLGDFFIHGIGGGKYDEVTDAIIREYFGVEPPAYQVLSATLHLPLPTFTTTDDDVKRAERHVRDLRWNPQVLVSERYRAQLVERHASLCASEPPYREHAARKTWFRELQQVKERLRARVATQIPAAEAELERARVEADANAILKCRDYSWVLYPEETLRPFMQRFLDL